MSLGQITRTWWWLIHKDLLREYRAPRVWPVMLMLGVVIALMIEMQLEVPRPQKANLVGGLFWIAVFFAGVVSLERSFSTESPDGCWRGLLSYPVAPATIYYAKLTLNFVALTCLELLLIPAFAVFSDVSLLRHPGPFLCVLVVANVGFAAVGTLVSALTNGHEQRSSLLVLLLLPLLSPVLLGSAQATRSLMLAEPEGWWRSWQLIACYAAVFVTLGTLVFEFVIED